MIMRADMTIKNTKVILELMTKTVESHSVLTEHALLLNRRFLEFARKFEKEINELAK